MIKNKSHRAWMFYDVGNSVYATSVMTFVFPVYFVSQLVPAEGVYWLGHRFSGSSLFPFLVSFSLAVTLIMTFFLSWNADRSQKRKFYLGLFTVLGCFATISLGFLKPGMALEASIFYGLSQIGFSGSLVFYNALLPCISMPDEIEKLSVGGWLAGYVGGFFMLMLHLVLLQFPQLVFSSKQIALQFVFISSGVWWFVWTIPLILEVDEKNRLSENLDTNSDGDSHFHGKDGVGDKQFLFKSRRLIIWFLAAYFLYNDAVQTAISQASNFAVHLISMNMESIMLAGVIIQFVSIFGSWFYLEVEKRWGTLNAVVSALAQWAIMLIWVGFMSSPWEFYVLSVWVGLVLGIVQSGSRTLFSRLIPEGKSSRYFVWYSITGKSAAVLGPLMVGLITIYANMRWSVFPLVLFLVVGTLLLYFKGNGKIENE